MTQLDDEIHEAWQFMHAMRRARQSVQDRRGSKEAKAWYAGRKTLACGHLCSLLRVRRALREERRTSVMRDFDGRVIATYKQKSSRRY